MPTCPNGHQSAADDWCEVCGHRVASAPGGAVPPPPPPPPPPGGYGYPGQGAPSAPMPGQPTAQAELCPQCHTPREAGAPFCEGCRYNFHTHSPTSYAPPAPPPGYQQQPGAPLGYDSSRPSEINRPAEPLAPAPPQQAGGDWPLPPPAPYPGQPYPGHPGQHGQPGPPHPGQHGGHHSQPGSQPGQHGQPGPGGGMPQPAGWMVTIAPDREYFTAMMQRSGPEAASLNLPAYSPEQQLPLSGHQVTIGRRRQSTGEAPDIDLARPPEDPGVSHQHAVLVRQPDGNWAVVDQDSTNGTTLNGAEDPIQPFVPIPLKEGDRVHVGAWTTITLRRA
ncbi:FHA domain-containing protein [Streptomyces gobiensis]|uniref:FHA domain-containing protein n=1 Tax=Streptomyces gobiensis TaxID=2875706 RepID=UPI001E650C17|nr:FHA domain-containing protein [Streptomyces gobiensis]UGY91451.1 FHA domain-containing protein [Streptomyces gobiensis]